MDSKQDSTSDRDVDLEVLADSVPQPIALDGSQLEAQLPATSDRIGDSETLCESVPSTPAPPLQGLHPELTPLESVVMNIVQDLPPGLAIPFKQSLQRIAQSFVKVPEQNGQEVFEWHIATLYSGCDIVLVVAHYLCSLFKRYMGIDVLPKNAFTK